MKVFLSHPMSGLSQTDVLHIRLQAYDHLQEKYGDIELIDNYNHENVPEDAGRLWHLGASIQQMGQADAIYFCPGWMSANGCQIEHEICKLYELRVLK